MRPATAFPVSSQLMNEHSKKKKKEKRKERAIEMETG